MPEAGGGSGKRILVVEDDQSFRESLKKVLSKEGYDVLEAGSGKEGLEVLASDHVEAVLLDYYLGDINGLGFLDQMREKKLPVILISAFANHHLCREALARGARMCLAKPVKKADLVAALSRIGLELRQEGQDGA